MAYTVELSFDTKKNSSTNLFCLEQRSLASQYECEFQYFMNEIEGKGNKIYRSDCIHVVNFNEDKFSNLLEYLAIIYRQRCMHIDCIYREDNSCNLLYISGRYLKRLDKNTARDIKRKYQKQHQEKPDVYRENIMHIFKNKNVIHS